MASQLERERMAESTAAYHERECDRWCARLNATDADDIADPLWDENERRMLYHYREAEAAEVRLIAIQFEGVTFDDLARVA